MVGCVWAYMRGLRQHMWCVEELLLVGMDTGFVWFVCYLPLPILTTLAINCCRLACMERLQLSKH